MAQPPDLKRVLETGIHFTELRRSQARRLASDLVAQGQLARDQLGAAVDELVDMSRRRSEELRAVVSSEVQRQLSVIGLATQRDLDALERRLNSRLAGRKPAATKAAPRKAAAKKAPAKKATKSPAKKTAATRTVRKSVTRRAPVKKTAGKRPAPRAR